MRLSSLTAEFAEIAMLTAQAIVSIEKLAADYFSISSHCDSSISRQCRRRGQRDARIGNTLASPGIVAQ